MGISGHNNSIESKIKINIGHKTQYWAQNMLNVTQCFFKNIVKSTCYKKTKSGTPFAVILNTFALHKEEKWTLN